MVDIYNVDLCLSCLVPIDVFNGIQNSSSGIQYFATTFEILVQMSTTKTLRSFSVTYIILRTMYVHVTFKHALRATVNLQAGRLGVSE